MSLAGFIRTGRAKKVAALLRHVEAGATAKEDAEIAHELSRWTRKQRIAFAKAAGVREPSDDSWTLLLVAIRERRIDGPPVAELRDAPIPVHVCELNEDADHFCKICGVLVESVIR